MSDYYEVQAAESRPAAACFTPPTLKSRCLSETIEATKTSSASAAPLSQLSQVSLAGGVAAAPTTYSGKEGERDDRAKAGPQSSTHCCLCGTRPEQLSPPHVLECVR